MLYKNKSDNIRLERKLNFRSERRVIRLALITGIGLIAALCSPLSMANNKKKSEYAPQIRSFLYREVARFAGSVGSNDFRFDIDTPELSPCDTPLAISRNQARQPIGKVTLTLECHKPNYWKSRAKADVKVYLKLVVAKNTIEREQTLNLKDLRRRRTDISYVRQGYFTKVSELKNQVSKRRITAGKIISPRMVEQRNWVERRQEVVIEAKYGNMTARMKGVALEAGSKGEQIKVKNSTTDKTILATVVGPQKVKTLF